uniref:Uncharacterized protein n=1 Tax=Calcidiscus leptoporus TaxID=127549 RepID=A0A7S0IWG8_9EUKA|mmetsp:Transcript_266/g.577  ORF Transcript_266/g.577 Transcript_266/m.577 type:complete len:1282 (+) Transcript_266:80-3925(+)
MEQLKTPKLTQPQSPQGAAAQLAAAGPLFNFGHFQAPASPAPQPHPFAATPQEVLVTAEEASRCKAEVERLQLSVGGELPGDVTRELRARELLLLPSPASFGLGGRETCWAFAGGSLFAWHASAPHVCVRLAPPADGIHTSAALACELAGDSSAMLVCWHDVEARVATFALYLVGCARAGGNGVYEPQLRAQMPRARCQLRLPEGNMPLALSALSPDRALCAIRGTSETPLFAVRLLLNADGCDVLEASPLSRSSGSKLLNVFFGAPRTLASRRPVLRLRAVGEEAFVLLGAEASSSNGRGEVIECWRRGSNGQLAELVDEAPWPLQLVPLLDPLLTAGCASYTVVDVSPHADCAGGAALLLLVAVLPDVHAACAHLQLFHLSISKGGAARVERGPPSDRIAHALPAAEFQTAAAGGVSLAAGCLHPGPVLVLRSAPVLQQSATAAGAPRFGGKGSAWMLRDARGSATQEALCGSEGASLLRQLLGPNADDTVLCGSYDEHGRVLLLLGSRLVRLGRADKRTASMLPTHDQPLGDERPNIDLVRVWDNAVAMLRGAAPPSEAVAFAAPHLSRVPRDELHMAMRSASARVLARKVAAEQLGISEAVEVSVSSVDALAYKQREHESLMRLFESISADGTLPHETIESGERLAVALALRSLHNTLDSQPPADGSKPPSRKMAETMMAVGATTADSQDPLCGRGVYEQLLEESARRVGTVSRARGDLHMYVSVCVVPLCAALQCVREKHSAAMSSPPPWTSGPRVIGSMADIALAVHTVLKTTEIAAGDALLDGLQKLHCLRLAFLLDILRAAPPPASPDALAQFRDGRTLACEQLEQHGALLLALDLAERFHDFKTLARLCTPTIGDDRRTCRERMVAKYAGVDVAELFPGEIAAALSRPFGQELLQCYLERGKAGCCAMLKLPDAHPSLADELRTFLKDHPGLLWLRLVEDANHPTAGTHNQGGAKVADLEEAARALYGWGLNQREGSLVKKHINFLSLGKLCHRAAMLSRSAEDELAVQGRAATQLQEREQSLVGVHVDGAEPAVRSVSFLDVAGECECFLLQEHLPDLSPQGHDGALAASTERLVSKLLEYATGQCTLRTAMSEPFPRTDALKHALDIVHKTTWRHGHAQARVRFERLMGILLCAFRAEVPNWQQLAANLPHMNRPELEVILGAHSSQAGEARGLLLYHVLSYEARMSRDPRRRRVQLVSAPSSEKVCADGGDFLAVLLHATSFAAHAGIKEALLRAQEVAELAAATEGEATASDVVDMPVDGEAFDMMRD